MIINFKELMDHKIKGNVPLTNPHIDLSWNASSIDDFYETYETGYMVSVTATWKFNTKCPKDQIGKAYNVAEKAFIYFTYGEILNRLIEIKFDFEGEIGISKSKPMEKLNMLINELKGEVYESY